MVIGNCPEFPVLGFEASNGNVAEQALIGGGKTEFSDLNHQGCDFLPFALQDRVSGN
jgi:hypothetical protein